MKPTSHIVASVVLLCITPTLFGQDKFAPPPDVAYQTADVISEGTRMSAEVFSPQEAAGKLPTILMSHGWGGTAEHLRPDGVAFARAGFVVVTFD